MIIVTVLPTEPEQEITAQELICGFVISSVSVTKLEILRQQSIAAW